MEPVGEQWMPDPSKKNRMRWWDGAHWTEHVSQGGKVWQSPLPADTGRKGRPWWFWALLALGALLLFTAPLLIATLALIALVTAVVGLARDRRTWLRLGTRKSALAAIAAAGAILLVASSVHAATNATNDPAGLLAANIPTQEGDEPATAPTTERATPTASPTPARTITEEVVTESIAFESATVDDPNLPAGQTVVTVAGVPGVKTLTYRVTWEGDTEVSRDLVSEVVTTPPVTQVTANGTYVAPPPPKPAPAAPSGCDPNYAEACVPIASDVDCAWGTGDGPAYLDGVARVVGSDIYGLDRDGDGLACERD